MFYAVDQLLDTGGIVLDTNELKRTVLPMSSPSTIKIVHYNEVGTNLHSPYMARFKSGRVSKGAWRGSVRSLETEHVNLPITASGRFELWSYSWGTVRMIGDTTCI